MNQVGLVVQCITIGLNPSLDIGSHILTLSIDDGGGGGDGWAIDFLTVGVTTRAGNGAPEPSSVLLVRLGLLAFATTPQDRR